MKKHLICLLTAFALTAGFLGCQKSVQPANETKPDTSKPQTVTTAEPASTKPDSTEPSSPAIETVSVAVKDYRTENGKYVDIYGIENAYDYHLPVISPETETTKAINENILLRFGELIDSNLGYKEKGEPLVNFNLSWEVYTDGDITSLVVSADNLWDLIDYAVYNYDAKQDRWLNTDEFMEYYGYERDYLTTCLKKTAIREYDYYFSSYIQLYNDDYFYDCRTYTVRNAVPDNVLLYQREGELYGIFTIGSLAGSGWFYSDLAVVDEPFVAEGAPAQCNYKNVWSMLRADNSVNISFEDSAKRPECLEGLELKDSDVAGCYQSYIQLRLGSCLDMPFLFLLTDIGTVEWVDVRNGLLAGYLCSNGPICCIPEIVSLENGTTSGGSETVYAVAKNGEHYDLAQYIFFSPRTDAAEIDTSFMFELISGSGDITTGHVDTATGNGYLRVLKINETKNTQAYYTGYFSRLGMNDTGMIYYYYFTNDSDSDENYCGSVSVIPDDGYDYTALYLTFLGGDDPFEIGLNNRIECRRTFG